MNVIDPQDATPQDATSQDATSQDATPQDAGSDDSPRRWRASALRNRFQLVGWAVFLLVGLGVTAGFIAAGGGVTFVFLGVWWAIVAAAGVRALRTATRVELYGDGSLLLIAPIRVVHAHVTRVESLREAKRWDDRGTWTEPDAVLDTADGAMRLPRGLVTEDLVDALREGSPDMTIPFFRGRR